MTVEIKLYPTRKVMRKEKQKFNQLGFRPLHTDFIEKWYRVTFVNGTDDPDNSDEAKESRLQFKLQKLLIQSIENDTIDFKDYKMLMRLERGLKLQQSTINKLVIIKQGGLSGILQRIKNLFNL